VRESAPVVVPVAARAVIPPRVAPAVRDVEEPGDPDVGASIESVDFGASKGTIFLVSSGSAETPVVWLMDDGVPTSDRIKPL
jgi:hypothetical protein